MKKTFLLFSLLFSLLSFAHRIDIGYEIVYLSSSYSSAKNTFCNQNLSVLPKSRINLISDGSHEELVVGKMYLFNNDDNPTYIYISRKNSTSFTDRDSYLFSSFNLQNFICEDTYSYDARNLGTSFSTARNIYCNQNPSTGGNRMDLNVSQPRGSSRLVAGKIYRFNDEGAIKYVYIVRLRAGEFSDRDTFSKSDFSIQNIICEDTYSYDARNLGTSFFTAQNIYCNQNPSTAGRRMDLNVSQPRESSRLVAGKIYRFNDEGTIKYVYIVRLRTGEFSDRDTFSKSDFTVQNFICEYDDFLDFSVKRLSIYSQKGVKLKEETVRNPLEEKQLMQSLPKGFYILNDDKGNSRKLSKQ